jgi:hypothetical protein
MGVSTAVVLISKRIVCNLVGTVRPTPEEGQCLITWVGNAECLAVVEGAVAGVVDFSRIVRRLYRTLKIMVRELTRRWEVSGLQVPLILLNSLYRSPHRSSRAVSRLWETLGEGETSSDRKEEEEVQQTWEETFQ